MRIFIFFLWFWGSGTAWTQTYIRAKAQAGDGITTLLRRYGLERYGCNVDKFCELNKLTRTAGLQVGKEYQLPVQAWRYDGKSVRGSVRGTTLEQARAIKHFNNNLFAEDLKPQRYPSGDKQVWVPHHLLHCAPAWADFVPKDRNFPVLGAEFAKVPLVDTKLAGAVYYIVAGHGGFDSGAMAETDGCTLCEDEYAYDVALRLARNLWAHGALVYLVVQDPKDGIRDSIYLACDVSETCGGAEIPLDHKERLWQRSDLVNKWYEENRRRGVVYQRLIELHVDSRSQKERIDVFFYFEPNDLLGFEFSNTIQRVFQQHYNRLRQKSNPYEGEVISRDLHMLRETRPVATFIELANIQNAADRKRILQIANRQLIADWLLEALLQDY